jgi:hypothetical protein
MPMGVTWRSSAQVIEGNAVGPQFLTDAALTAWERGVSAAAQAPGGHGHGGQGGCCGGGGCK